MELPKLSSKSFAVIGLGFGDEGKGLTTNYLCGRLPNPMVVRYSGGQQAGHTVTLKDGTSHVFSNFGSASFIGVPTYWSSFCTFDPVGVKREYAILSGKRAIPTLYIDKNAPVTTPYDKTYNRKHSNAINHGTCGLGVGATYKREQANCSLLAGDLKFPSVVRIKLEAIKEYYIQKCLMPMENNVQEVEKFMSACAFVTSTPGIEITEGWPNHEHSTHFVFEGSQGLLLDQNIGFFPHVTPSNTGTKNIIKMSYPSGYPHLFLVTRAFQTRHGNGPMTNEDLPHNIKDNPKETNVLNDFQGKFRKSLLDLDLLKYGMDRDMLIRSGQIKTLVITCLDLVENEFRYTVGGKIVNHLNRKEFVKGIALHLGVRSVLTCDSPDGNFQYDYIEG